MSTRTLSVALLVMGVGCADDPRPGKQTGEPPTCTGADCETDPTQPTQPTTPVDCGFEVLSLVPADGATEVFLHPEFDVVQVETDVPVALTVRPAEGGDAVPGTQDDLGSLQLWTPDSVLDSSTEYEVVGELDGCSDRLGTFTQGPWIQPDLAAMVGNLYILDFDTADGANALMAVHDAAQGISFGFWARGQDDWLLVPLDGSSQEICYPTTAIDQVGSSESHLSWNYVNAPYGAPELLLRTVELSTVALVSPDGASLDRVNLWGQVDLSELNAGLGFDICPTLVTFGGTCSPCSDGSGPTCLDVDIRHATGAPVSAAGVSFVSNAQATCP